jgi:hypothetical protein
LRGNLGFRIDLLVAALAVSAVVAAIRALVGIVG